MNASPGWLNTSLWPQVQGEFKAIIRSQQHPKKQVIASVSKRIETKVQRGLIAFWISHSSYQNPNLNPGLTEPLSLQLFLVTLIV